MNVKCHLHVTAMLTVSILLEVSCALVMLDTVAMESTVKVTFKCNGYV